MTYFDVIKTANKHELASILAALFKGFSEGLGYELNTSLAETQLLEFFDKETP